MSIVELLGNVVTSILIGYLTFTNMLAGYVESVLPQGETVTQVENTSPQTNSETEKLELFSTIETISQSLVPKVLLENRDFQQAALIASAKNETTTTSPATSIEALIADALVNVYCQYKTETYIRTTTGTGFFINQKGVILTNAHVAQFLLLEDTGNTTHDVDCVIRSGNPAVPKYKAELLYISPTWILQNAQLITEESPIGTGERDYALLYVSKTLDNSPLPTYFPSLPIDIELLPRSIRDTTVLTAGYPAGALLRNGADAKLTPVIARSQIGSLYTFGSNYADLFSISESAVGEHGASGGPIVTPNTKNVIGLIVTKGDTQTEGERSLRAITVSYIDRTIIQETGFSLAQNMYGDVAYRGLLFKNIMSPFLARLLEKELEYKNTP